MDPVFDAHLHLFSLPYYESLATKAPGAGSPSEKLSRLERGAGIRVPGPDLPEHVMRWLQEFDRHGVERAVVFSSSPEEAQAVEQASLLANGRFVPAALIDPTSSNAAARAKELLAKGFRAILLFPALHRYAVGSPESRAVVAEAAKVNAVVYVQCGMLKVPVRDFLGFPRSVDLSFANPLDLIPVADAYAGTSFVIPHVGAGFLRETLMTGSQCGNVCVDTSSSNGWIVTDPSVTGLADVLRKALAVFGPDRILFGTDSSTFPRGWRNDVRGAQVRAFAEAGLAGQGFAKVFAKNAERLFGLA